MNLGIINCNTHFIYRGESDVFKSINFETGETLWQSKIEFNLSPFYAGNENYTAIACSGVSEYNNFGLKSLWLLNNKNGNFSELTKPEIQDIEINYSISSGIGGYHTTIPFSNELNELCVLATGYFELVGGNYFDFFEVYNVEKEVKVLGHISLSNVATSLPQVIEQVAYFALYQEFCAYDLSTGEKLWGRNYENRFHSSGFIIHDSTIFALQEGVNDYLISLDRFSGRENWKVPAHQASSYIHYLDGVIYYTNGRLYAYDATNGQQLWSIESPDGTLFGSDCYAIPGKNGGKGKIIAGTGLHAYCYEAER